MKMSAIGRAVLASREGVRLTAYLDSVGVMTIGVGHTAACGPPIPRRGLMITAAECDATFARDLVAFETAMTRAVKVPLADHEADALLSFAFNVGASGAASSTAVRRLNAGDRVGAAEALLRWDKPATIIDRRRGERDQFLTPYETRLPKARRSDTSPVNMVRTTTPQPAVVPSTATPSGPGAPATPSAAPSLPTPASARPTLPVPSPANMGPIPVADAVKPASARAAAPTGFWAHVAKLFGRAA